MKLRQQNVFSPQLVTGIVFVVFALIYCLISLVNHYMLRTYAADLGLFEHALYSFSNFKADRITLNLDGNSPSFLGDHFSPIVILFIPFYWLFGSYGLLILQILAILAGGGAVYKCTQLFSDKKWLPIIISLQYFSLLPIYSSLAFDFHTNVIAAALLPWLIYYYFKKKPALVLLFLILLLITKEAMSLWMVFVFLGLMIINKQSIRAYLRFEIPIIIFSLLFFLLLIQIVMPYLRDYKGEGQMLWYSHLGDSMGGIIFNLLKHPGILLEALYKNTSGNVFFDGVKGEFHMMVLLSGGVALILRPAWLIMLIPLYAQKLLSGNAGLWGINNHYSIEFVPVLCLATAQVLSKISRKWLVYSLCGLQVLLTMGFTFSKLENRKHQWYDRVNNRFYMGEHYQSNVRLDKVYDILENIPDGIPLSVSAELAPHLAFREKVYFFPVIRDAQMIVIFSDKKGDYPVNREERLKLCTQLQEKGEFRLVLDRDDILILERVASLDQNL